MTVAPAIVCLVSGHLLVSLGWTRRKPLWSDLLLRVSLAVGLGLGLFSVVFFLCRTLNTTSIVTIDWVMLALLAVAFAARARISSAAPAAVVVDHGGQWPRWFQRVLTAAFAIALLMALYAAIMRMLAFPHGDGWDAFAIWNFHARHLFRGGAHWRDGFTALARGSHPDYPLLLPAAIAHFWTYIGWDDPRIPAVIGVVFTFATVGVLFATLAILRGRVQAIMGAIALLSTPFFIEQGTAQYADVPLAFFLVATVALLCLFDGLSDGFAQRASGLQVLAGLSAGFAAWTKNEGLLFVCAIVASRLLIFIRGRTDLHENKQRSEAALAPLGAGMAPGLLLIAYFKHSIAVPGDLFSDPATAVRKLLEPSRYWAVMAGCVKGFFRFGHWLWIPGTLLLAGLYFVACKNDGYSPQPGFRTSVGALLLTVAGYFGVLLITPYDIHWHLRFSLARLFLQLWPSTVLLFFLTVRIRPRRCVRSDQPGMHHR
jgi:hypothetical protein